MKSLNPLTREFEWKEVVPAESGKAVISDYHSEPTAGHLGIFKNHKCISFNYFWPNMHKDVLEFVHNCKNENY